MQWIKLQLYDLYEREKRRHNHAPYNISQTLLAALLLFPITLIGLRHPWALLSPLWLTSWIAAAIGLARMQNMLLPILSAMEDHVRAVLFDSGLWGLLLESETGDALPCIKRLPNWANIEIIPSPNRRKLHSKLLTMLANFSLCAKDVGCYPYPYVYMQQARQYAMTAWACAGGVVAILFIPVMPAPLEVVLIVMQLVMGTVLVYLLAAIPPLGAVRRLAILRVLAVEVLREDIDECPVCVKPWWIRH